QRLGRHPQGDRHAVLALARAAFLLRLVALGLPGADAKPAGEVLLRREAADIDADLGQDDQGRPHVDAVDFRQIDPQRLERAPTGIEVQVVGFAAAAPRLGCGRLLPGAAGEPAQFGFDHGIALGDLLVAEAYGVVGLP